MWVRDNLDWVRTLCVTGAYDGYRMTRYHNRLIYVVVWWWWWCVCVCVVVVVVGGGGVGLSCTRTQIQALVLAII